MWGVNAKQIDWKCPSCKDVFHAKYCKKECRKEGQTTILTIYTFAGTTTKETEQSQGFHDWGIEGVLPPAENLLIPPSWKNLPPNSYSPTRG